MNIEEIQQQLAEIRGEAAAGSVLGATGIYLMLKTAQRTSGPLSSMRWLLRWTLT